MIMTERVFIDTLNNRIDEVNLGTLAVAFWEFDIVNEYDEDMSDREKWLQFVEVSLYEI